MFQLYRCTKDNEFEALSIQDYDCFITYSKFQLFMGLDAPVKCSAIQNDTLWTCYNEGDTIVFDNKKVIINKKGFDKLALLYNRLNKQRTTVSDSNLKNLWFKPSIIKVEAKEIETDKY